MSFSLFDTCCVTISLLISTIHVLVAFALITTSYLADGVFFEVLVDDLFFEDAFVISAQYEFHDYKNCSVSRRLNFLGLSIKHLVLHLKFI
jgi:hypothetical protein